MKEVSRKINVSARNVNYLPEPKIVVTRLIVYHQQEILNDKGEWEEINEYEAIKDNQFLELEGFDGRYKI